MHKQNLHFLFHCVDSQCVETQCGFVWGEGLGDGGLSFVRLKLSMVEYFQKFFTDKVMFLKQLPVQQSHKQYMIYYIWFKYMGI